MSRIEVKRRYAESSDVVLAYFLDVKNAQEFLFRTPQGKLLGAELSPEIGGTFCIHEQRANEAVLHHGTFLEVDPPQRVSFVFSVGEGTDETDFVEIQMTTVAGASGCELTLSHEFADQHQSHSEKISEGWNKILESLSQLIKANENAEAHRQANKVIQPKDSLGQLINEGDTVKTIKDLKVKGSSMVIKRGTLVRKVHLVTGNDEEVDCRVDGVALALETQWLVRVDG